MRKFWITTSAVLNVLLAASLIAFAVSHLTTKISSPTQSPQTTMASGQSQARKTLYWCSMDKIIQDHPGKCPICGMELTPIQGSVVGRAGQETGEKKILYYWDPMLGPSSISKTPGKSAMGMDLVPVFADEVSSGTGVTIDPTVVQNMGVQTATITKGSLNKSIRVVGMLEVPETGLHDITLKISGYIDKLYADTTGMHLHKDAPLFDLYSTDLIVAEEELIAARKSVDSMSSAAPEARKLAQELLASARRKLELWDIPDTEINVIAKLDHAQKDITIRSPVEGHLEEKMIVQGSAVQAGMKLMRIEDHRTLWLEAKVYEGQLPFVEVGEMADATLDAMPGKTFSGKIVFISPHLDHMNRTTAVRVELENPDFELKPGMYATVQIHAKPVDDAILVPSTAVIDTGTRQLVFVQEDKGHFSPRTIKTGLSGDKDQVQVLAGLAPGETVVTSGQFLMDVESRTLEAAQKFLASSSTQPAAPTEASMPTTGPELMPTLAASTGESDGVAKAYLAVANYLQQDHADNKPADVSAVVQSSGALAEHTAAAENKSLAIALKDAAAAMEGQTLEVQHKTFEKVGAAMVALIIKYPPSSAVTSSLYIVNCPMENADWLQTVPAVSNPFLPSMRTCGSVIKTIQLSPAAK